jgi:hypothetical protein
MVGSERIIAQLNLSAGEYSANRSCMDVNKHAVDVAIQLLTDANLTFVLERYHRRGRTICFLPDFAPVGNIGPLFVHGSMSVKDNTATYVPLRRSYREPLSRNVIVRRCPHGMEVASIAVHTQLDSALFPGVQYCKMLSPARVIDYIMSDSLKNVSGCLNV